MAGRAPFAAQLRCFGVAQEVMEMGWEGQPKVLRTNGDCVAALAGRGFMNTSAGRVQATLPHARIA